MNSGRPLYQPHARRGTSQHPLVPKHWMLLPGTPQQPFGFTGPDIPGGDPLTPKFGLTLVPEFGSANLG